MYKSGEENPDGSVTPKTDLPGNPSGKIKGSPLARLRIIDEGSGCRINSYFPKGDRNGRCHPEQADGAPVRAPLGEAKGLEAKHLFEILLSPSVRKINKVVGGEITTHQVELLINLLLTLLSFYYLLLTIYS